MPSKHLETWGYLGEETLQRECDGVSMYTQSKSLADTRAMPVLGRLQAAQLRPDNRKDLSAAPKPEGAEFGV